MLAGVLWILTGLAGRFSPDADDWDCNSSADYVTNTLGATTFLVTSVAILGVYYLHRDRFRWLGTTGTLAASIGTLVAGINNPIEHCGSVGAMGVFVWVPAVILWLLGSIIMAGAMVRSRVLPFWVGSALLMSTLICVLAFNSVGFIVYGLSWLTIGCNIRFALSVRLASIP